MRKTIGQLLGLLKPFWRGVSLSVLLAVLTVASSVGLMATSAWMISKSGLQPSIADLGVSVVGVRFFGIARGVFRYLERVVSHEITFRLLARLRVAFYEAVEPLVPAQSAQWRSGDILGRVIADVDTLQNVYLRVFSPPIVALLIGVLITTLLAGFSPFVALIGGVGYGLSATVPTALAWWASRHVGAEWTQQRAELNAQWVDMLQGLADSTFYGSNTAQKQALLTQFDALKTTETRLGALESVQNGLGVLFANMTMFAVLAVAIGRVEGIFLATLALSTIASLEAVTPLSVAVTQLGANVASAERLFSLMNTPPNVTESAHALPAPTQFDITFDRLTFAYSPEEQPVFSRFSLSIGQGERVAIVGESGIGKSTLVNLLTRLWEDSSGAVRLGGRAISAYRLEDIRACMGVMSQRTHLFNTTLLENVRIARPFATDEDVRRACEQAQLTPFIDSLPQGYETVIGENGAFLSGGQRQRLALARVLLKDAPVWLLDEPTAHLDAITEKAVLDTVFSLTEGRTVLWLTHRLTHQQKLSWVEHLTK